MKRELWFKEYHSEDFYISFRIGEHLFSKKTEYQQIDVIENSFWGRVLLIDGLVMLTEKDEHFYHEAISHPALSSPVPTDTVCIIGGGDGGTLREVLKYDVKKVFLVEIDKEVVEVSKKFFPEISSSFEDGRVSIFNEDGIEFIKRGDCFFDAIIIDSSEPFGPSKRLFSKEFYNLMKKRLKKGGVIVSQLGSFLFHKDFIENFLNDVKELFKYSYTYLSPTPTYPGGIWVFGFFSDESSPLNVNIDKGKTVYINTELFKGSLKKA